MLNNHIEMIGGILIGSIVILCSIILIIAIYFLYRYRQKNIFLRQNFNEKVETNLNHQEKTERNDLIVDQMTKPAEEEEISDSPRIIGELMRKSLQLAKTAEKVADHHEKRFSVKDNIHFHF